MKHAKGEETLRDDQTSTASQALLVTQPCPLLAAEGSLFQCCKALEQLTSMILFRPGLSLAPTVHRYGYRCLLRHVDRLHPKVTPLAKSQEHRCTCQAGDRSSIGFLPSSNGSGQILHRATSQARHSGYGVKGYNRHRGLWATTCSSWKKNNRNKMIGIIRIAEARCYP